MVDLNSVPASGTANFEYLVRTYLGQWEVQIEANANEVIAARFGEADLATYLATLADGTGIASGTITEVKLDVLDSPSDGETLTWNAGAGKFEWTVAGSPTDTGEVRMNAGDAKDYLDQKIDNDTIGANGSNQLYVKENNIIAWC